MRPAGVKGTTSPKPVVVRVTTDHHMALGELPNCCGWPSRSAIWAPDAADIARIANTIRTLAIGARSLEITRPRVPKAGACGPVS